MIARFTGASLGFLASTVAVAGGLWVGNPVAITLSRAIGSLVVFCMIGLLVGAAAQAVVNDYARRQTGSGQAAGKLRGGIERAKVAPDEPPLPTGSTAAGR